MAKKNKQRKGLEGEKNVSGEDTVTGHASSLSAWERAVFMVEPNHELDSDGDFFLILNFFFFFYNIVGYIVRS